MDGYEFLSWITLMLYLLYTLTSKRAVINETARNLIIFLELPILRMLLKAAGAEKAEPRNSIYEREYFNIFMSDLDFTVCASEDRFEKIHKFVKRLRILFPNMGEIELYTAAEWRLLQELQNSRYWHYWQKTYLIRKLSWQMKKSEKASTKYEITKQKRSLSITFKKLGQTSFPLKGEDIFHDLPAAENLRDYGTVFCSRFLESNISNLVNQGAVFFESQVLMKALISVLPDHDDKPQNEQLTEIRGLIIQREYLLALTSLRLQKFDSPEKSFLELQSWLQDLQKKIPAKKNS